MSEVISTLSKCNASRIEDKRSVPIRTPTVVLEVLPPQASSSLNAPQAAPSSKKRTRQSVTPHCELAHHQLRSKVPSDVLQSLWHPLKTF